MYTVPFVVSYTPGRLSVIGATYEELVPIFSKKSGFYKKKRGE